jgi:predicted RNase H-like nuclease (RuvC/YqgF family)
MAITNLIVPGNENVGQNERQQSSNSTEIQTGESNSPKSQRTIAEPGTPGTSISSEQEQQAWASIQVQNIQMEIQALKADIAQRTNAVASIDRDLCNLKEEYETYDGTMAQDMARELGKMKKDYNKKLDDLKSTLMELAESRVNELDEDYNRKLKNYNELKNERNRKLDALMAKLLSLGDSKRNELGRLDNNALEISRKVTGLVCYNGIITYLDREAKGGD